MCRLLGLVANKPVDIGFSLLKADKPFKEFGYKNPDGWGIGWYDERHNAKVFKEAIPIHKSNQLLSLSKEVVSNIIIAHVRKGTVGKPSERNSHPFKYKNWLFAHNGSVDKKRLLDLLNSEFRKKLEGETDSEVYFYWLLQCIQDASNDVTAGIKKAIKEIVQKIRHTALNFLLSDGSCLYAFRYSQAGLEACYSLYWLRREPSISEQDLFEFESEETKALLRSKSLKGEKAILVCSEKLTGEKGWEEIRCGNVLIIEPDLKTKEEKIL